MTTFDAHENLVITTVATAPSPATSGTSLVVASGHGADFPAAPFNVTVWPASQTPTKANAEILRVTAVSTDTLTIVRAREGTFARTIVVGDQIAVTITAKTVEDIEGAVVDLEAAVTDLEASSAPALTFSTPPARIWREVLSASAPTFDDSHAFLNDGAYNAFPALAVNIFGTLIAVYREGASHTSVDGKVTIQTSLDGGTTWSSKTYLVSPASGHDYRDPSIVCTATGRLIVNFFDFNGSSVLGLYTMVSDDGGTTWSSPALLAGYTSWTATSGPILQHSRGTLVMPVYGRDSGDTTDQMGVFVSDDDGDTWGSVIHVTAANNGYSEATLVEIADRSILAFIRRDVSGSQPIYLSTSDDLGITWSAPASIGFSQSPARPAGVVVPISQALILFYRGTSTSDCKYRYSLNGGATWSSEQTYSGLPYMYAAGVALKDDLVGFVIAREVSSSNSSLDFASMRVAAAQSVADTGVVFADNTTGNVTSTKHGFAPKSPADSTKFLDGSATPVWDTVKDSDLSTSDITTNDVSTSKHGFVPKAPNDTTKFLRGDATWATTPSALTWSVLTNGNVSSPELVFAGGDVIMVVS